MLSPLHVSTAFKLITMHNIQVVVLCQTKVVINTNGLQLHHVTHVSGLCQMQHKKLLIAVAQAYDQGIWFISTI